jgi:hypothetical protein
MEINRNQYFLAGMVILLLGIQLRLVDTFELNDHTTRFIAQRSGQTDVQTSLMFTSAQVTGGKKQIKPPQWIGWCLLSVGSVLILHSLAMKRPG